MMDQHVFELKEWARVHTSGFRDLSAEDEGLCLCPFHDDHNPSCWLGFGARNGRFKCRACGASGTLGDLADRLNVSSPLFRTKNETEAEYVYVRPDGSELLKVVRIRKEDGAKTFPQYHRRGVEWVKGRVRPNPLFKADELVQATAGTLCFVVEGEKAALAGRAKGLLCTTAPMGAGKFDQVGEEYLDLLRPLSVVILPDNDEPGRKHANQIKQILAKVGILSRIVELPNLPAKGDLADTKLSGAEIMDLVNSRYKGDSGDTVTAGHQKPYARPVSPGSGAMVTAGDSGDTWEEPLPIYANPTLPEFPVEALGATLAPYGRAVIRALQPPPDLVGLGLLGMLSTVLTKAVEIEVGANWIEPANLYLLAGADVADRKSATLSEIREPISALEQIVVQEVRAENSKRRRRRDEIEQHLAKTKGKAAPNREQLLAELDSDELKHLPKPQLWTDNSGMEKLACICASSPLETVAVISAEAHFLKNAAGAYRNNDVLLGILLPGYSRKEPYREDRIGRESVDLRDPLISICCSVQPEVILGFLRKKEFRDLGLVARFWVSLSKSPAGYRDLNPPSIPGDLRIEYRELLRKLFALRPNAGRDPLLISLSHEAKRMFDDLRSWCETEIRPGASLYEMRDWASRLPGNTARVALLLHMSKHPEKDAPCVSADTMGNALRIAEWALEHGKAVFQIGTQNDKNQDAAWVLERLRKFQSEEGSWDTFTIRELHRRTQRQFPTADRLRGALTFLHEYGYLRPADPDQKQPTRYVVNPRSWTPADSSAIVERPRTWRPAERNGCVRPDAPVGVGA